MESDDNVSGEFQRSTRMPLDAVVRLHFKGTVAYQNGFAANVSATGMFVKHPAPPSLGTQLVFEFNLGADRKPVQGAGEVVWVRDKYLGPGQPAGVGIRFLQLDSQSRDHIAEALFEYLEQSLTEDSLLDSSGYSFDTETPPASTAADDAVATPGGGADFGAPGRTEDNAATAPPELRKRADFAEIGDIYGETGGVSATPARPAAEPFDFAALERLPSPAAESTTATASAAGDGKRAFSVFSTLDEADPQTADIVRAALREEAPLPMMAAAAAASSERQGSSAWQVALLLALLAGGGYLGWRQWGANWLAQRSASTAASSTASSRPAPASVPRPDPLTAAPEPGTTLAETVGVDPNSLSSAAVPPHSAPSAAPPEEPSDVAAAGQENTGTQAATAIPAADPQPPPAETVAAESMNPVAPATAARAERLTGIEWSEAGETAGQTALVLAGDGAFTTGSFSYSEIGGESPRVLIKLKGMQSPYRGPAPRGAGTLVRGVRTGFHVTASGNEIHVVVDLARGGVKVVSLAPAAAGLTLTLAP